jgi:hypothetical protein
VPLETDVPRAVSKLLIGRVCKDRAKDVKGMAYLSKARRFCVGALFLLLATSGAIRSQNRIVAPQTSLARLLAEIHTKADKLQGSSGMWSGYESFTAAHHLAPDSIHYSDYVIVRLLFEATRDAGFWNLHWTITNQPPNSDSIWRQWKTDGKPSPQSPTASAECDELSALYAFLAEREGIRTVGLFWPYPNHTVAVWVVHPTTGPAIRVVVPTSQIFLEQTDFFDTTKFDPWRQKVIYEYKRRDVPDSFELPKPLFNFFLQQADKYAGASDLTLQQLRYMREGVFLKYWTPEAAAEEALRRRTALGSAPAEDLAAFQNFAQDMRSTPSAR